MEKRSISGLNPSEEITCLKTDGESCHSISSLNFLDFQSAVMFPVPEMKHAVIHKLLLIQDSQMLDAKFPIQNPSQCSFPKC